MAPYTEPEIFNWNKGCSCDHTQHLEIQIEGHPHHLQIKCSVLTGNSESFTATQSLLLSTVIVKLPHLPAGDVLNN